MSDNIIPFPNKNKNATDLDGGVSIVTKTDTDVTPANHEMNPMATEWLARADELADEWIDHLAVQFENAEIAEMSSEYFRDLHHVGECIRSLIYRHMGVPHPFQKFADNTIKLRYKDGNVIASWDEKAFDIEDEIE